LSYNFLIFLTFKNLSKNKFFQKMSLELTGTLLKVMPEVNGQGKNGPWVKQEFVIEVPDGQYSKKVCMSAWGERTNDLKRFAIGDTVRATFSVESREYNERWYTDIRAFRIEVADDNAFVGGSEAQAALASRPKPAATPLPAVADLPSFSEGGGDDLPF
jgi:hypothetical protein